jgi:hypothetical protein
MLWHKLVGDGDKPPVSIIIPDTAKSDAVNRSAYTFTGVAFGPEAPDRIIAVPFAKSGGTGYATAVTIGGVSATIVQPMTTNQTDAGLAYAFVPTGTSGTITITLHAGLSGCRIFVYNLTNAAGAYSSDHVSGTSSSASMSVSAPKGSVVIGNAAMRANQNITWSGDIVTNGQEDAQIYDGENTTTSWASSLVLSEDAAFTAVAAWSSSVTSGSTLVCFR